jgi:hypothetical protein
MTELTGLAQSGGFIPLREASLYIQEVGGALHTSLTENPRKLARELLLLSVETFDDALVGYTEHTHSLAERTDTIFGRLESKA